MDQTSKLAVAAAGGDRIALHQFIRATQTDVWRLCAALAGRDHADDLTQETYVRALKALPSFRAEAPVRVWLLAIARRTAADAIRSMTRQRRLLRSVADQGPQQGTDPAESVSIDALLGDLDPDQQTAFVLTQVLGLRYADAALVCGCPVGTIRSRIARARATLVERIASDDRAFGAR